LTFTYMDVKNDKKCREDSKRKNKIVANNRCIVYIEIDYYTDFRLSSYPLLK